MEIKVTETRPQKLLSRTLLVGEISYSKTAPTMAEVKEKVASMQKADKEAVVIKLMKNKFGVRQSKLIACVYDNKESLKKIEPKSKKEEKKEGEAKPAAAEAPKKEEPKAEEKKEEAPKEEKPKEEAKPEAKKEEKAEEKKE